MSDSTFIGRLEWRHATKSFDTARSVPESALKSILHAVRMAPTSYGLQPFYVRVFTDAEAKKKVSEAGFNQAQFTTASHVLAFIVRKDVSERITAYIDLVTGGDPAKKAHLKGYEGMMRGSLEKMSQDQLQSWAAKQAYIALGFAMAACAELQVDSCPMEGFAPAQMDKNLNVPAGEHVCVLLTLGYRDAAVAVRPKVRFPHEDIVRFG